jgi:hypothetical protein
MIAEQVDTEILDELDFEPPCEGEAHALARYGHNPEESAAYLIRCRQGGDSVLQCASRVAFMRACSVMKCSRCGTVHRIDMFEFIPLGETT